MRQLSFRGLVCSFACSLGSFIVLSVIWAIVLRVFTGPFRLSDVVIMLGIGLAWPWLEWAAHKYFMHEWTSIPFYKSHARHHDNPTPSNGLPDPWVLIIYFAIPAVLCWYGFMWIASANLAILAMLAFYEFVHFSCHVNYRPRTGWGWRIRVNHLKHHRFDETRYMSMLFPAREVEPARSAVPVKSSG